MLSRHRAPEALPAARTIDGADLAARGGGALTEAGPRRLSIARARPAAARPWTAREALD